MSRYPSLQKCLSCAKLFLTFSETFYLFSHAPSILELDIYYFKHSHFQFSNLSSKCELKKFMFETNTLSVSVVHQSFVLFYLTSTSISWMVTLAANLNVFWVISWFKKCEEITKLNSRQYLLLPWYFRVILHFLSS